MAIASVTDKFADLEERILRAVEVIKSTRIEKEAAERQINVARAQITELERELDQLRRERDQIRNKVESLLDVLSQLTEDTVV
jgi:chromosome segregation ATPase